MKELATLLQEIDRKKAIIDQARPLPAIVLNNLKEYLDIEWTYNSNSIEGNTMSREETMLILKEGLTISGKSMKEHLEVTNHKNAIDYLEMILTKVEPITQNDVKKIHSFVLEGINNQYAGRYREVEIFVPGSGREFPGPQAVEGLMLEFSRWLVERQEKRDLHPVSFSAQAHFKLVDIHPFVDGNGRTARLLMNLILMRYGYPIAIIECEMEKRKQYYAAIRQGHGGKLQPFEILLAEYVDKTADKYLGSIPVSQRKKLEKEGA